MRELKQPMRQRLKNLKNNCEEFRKKSKLWRVNTMFAQRSNSGHGDF